MNTKTTRWLIVAVVLIVAGAAAYGIGRSTVLGNEGSIVMENQSYALSEVTRIQIDTDSPNVVIKPTAGNQINLSWQTDKYIQCELALVNGELTVDYRYTANWLEALLMAPLNRNDYTLEVELPESYTGGLAIHTASGAVGVDIAAKLNECVLSSVSGSVDAANLDSQVSIEVRSTSGSVTVESVRAEGDILIQTVSGSAALFKSATKGSASLQTTSGSITAAELTAVDGVRAKTISGRTELMQVQCDADVSMESTSGSLKPADVSCAAFTAKSVSGSIGIEGLSADTIELKSTSGSVSGTVHGLREEFTVTVHTVSGSSNLQSTVAGQTKALKIDTVSGGINVTFSGVSGN